MRRAQTMGQKMDQARARFRRAVESGEKSMQVLQKAKENSEQSTAGGDASPDRPGDAHAGSFAASDASSTSQHEPWQILGSFDRNHRKSVEPRRRTAIRQPGPRNPGVEADPSDLVGDPVPGGWCSFGRRSGCWAGSRVMGRRRGRSRGDGGHRGGTCSRPPPVEATMSRARKAAMGNTPITAPPMKTRTAAPAAVEQGGAQSSQAQRLSARAMLNPRDTELFTLSQRACAIIPALASS